MLTPLPRAARNMFGREEAITGLRCISPQVGGCGRQIQPAEILQWSQLTLKEYRQSGWCLACQNRIFREDVVTATGDRCSCDSIDVGLEIPMPIEDPHCEVHADPDFLVDCFDYDPDMREDEPPHDITEIVWSVNVL